MSQDNITCAICNKPCGYDDAKGIWFGSDRDGDIHAAICGQCKRNLAKKVSAFLGMDGWSGDEYGMDIEWHILKYISDKIKMDYCMRTSYIVTDKELYERTKNEMVSILA